MRGDSLGIVKMESFFLSFVFKQRKEMFLKKGKWSGGFCFKQEKQ